MTRITNHALEHWCGRCRQWAPPRKAGDHRRIEAKTYLRSVVQAGRMATVLEARALSLWIARATHQKAMLVRRLDPGDCIVSDEHGVIFTLAFDGDTATVITAVLLATVTRWAATLPASRPRYARQEV